MSKNDVQISKFLSLVLRHKPEEIGLQLDANGWAEVNELLEKINKKGLQVDMPLLEHIVDTNPKKRFAFNEGKTKIRANQGHSIDIELDLKPVQPPITLYHGTADRFVDDILKTGLEKRQRQHVHLSVDIETATQVGKRHGKPIILTVDSGSMFNDGYIFFLSENGVWLTETVPAKYLKRSNH